MVSETLRHHMRVLGPSGKTRFHDQFDPEAIIETDSRPSFKATSHHRIQFCAQFMFLLLLFPQVRKPEKRQLGVTGFRVGRKAVQDW